MKELKKIQILRQCVKVKCLKELHEINKKKEGISNETELQNIQTEYVNKNSKCNGPIDEFSTALNEVNKEERILGNLVQTWKASTVNLEKLRKTAEENMELLDKKRTEKDTKNQILEYFSIKTSS